MKRAFRVLQYLWYVIRHKYYVLLECWKMGLIWRGITHDLSKFRPREITGYTDRFHDPNVTESNPATRDPDESFKLSWNHHQNSNTHHWNYWCVVEYNGRITTLPMPDKDIKEMVADWRAMARMRGNEPEDWWRENEGSVVLHPDTRERVVELLMGDPSA